MANVKDAFSRDIKDEAMERNEAQDEASRLRDCRVFIKPLPSSLIEEGAANIDVKVEPQPKMMKQSSSLIDLADDDDTTREDPTSNIRYVVKPSPSTMIRRSESQRVTPKESNEVQEDPPSNIRVVIKSLPTTMPKKSESLLDAIEEEAEMDVDDRELFTHFYVPEGKPAPYAESLDDEEEDLGNPEEAEDASLDVETSPDVTARPGV